MEITKANEYLAPDMVAALFPGLTTRWLERKRWEKKAPAYSKAGRKVLYLRQEIEAYLAANAVIPLSEG